MQTEAEKRIQKKYRSTDKFKKTSKAWRQSPSGKLSAWTYAKTPRALFNSQKSRAKARGILFLMTFDEWWSLWSASGKWEKRGIRAGQYVMGRLDDCGAYETGNVQIIRNSENIAHMRSKLQFGKSAGILSFGI